MSRLLFWNVDNFNYDKFYRRKRKRVRDDDAEFGGNRAAALLDFLVTSATTNNPQFIAIVEVQPGQNNLAGGQVVSDLGAIQLLRTLKTRHSNAWRLVPPLVLGQNNRSEGVAVFYRSDAYYFTGPWRFPGGANGVAGSPTAVNNAAVYPASWRRSLPARRIPANNVNILHNRGQWENRLASQWQFTRTVLGVQQQIDFPNNGYRQPCLTTFFDVANNRNITLLTFHAPPDQRGGGNPQQAESVQGTLRLSTITEIQAVQNNEVQIIVGDFNISVFDNNAIGTAYQPLTNLGFTRLINATANQFPDKGYVITHVMPIGLGGATPFNTRGYPAFGYMSGPSQHGIYDSIDNAFARFGNAAGGPAANLTIVNRVSGSPYTAVMPVPVGAPPGHYAYATALAEPASLNSPIGIDPDSDDAGDYRSWFIDEPNYPKIRDTSDHMPLIFDF